METTELKRRAHLTLLAAASVLFACTQGEAPVCRNDPPGFLITNVEIIDGSGSPAIAGDVRVNDGLIADLGDLKRCEGETVVDGGGQTLTPGFIDTHSHADGGIFDHPDALVVVSQGITTVIVGQDGGSPYPLSEFFSNLEDAPATVNVASYEIGRASCRERV